VRAVIASLMNGAASHEAASAAGRT